MFTDSLEKLLWKSYLIMHLDHLVQHSQQDLTGNVLLNSFHFSNHTEKRVRATLYCIIKFQKK